MSAPTSQSLEGIFLKIAEAAPGAWFPGEYATAQGIARDSLDPFLDDLRMGGLAECYYEQGRGQGYKLTDTGREVAADSKKVAQLRKGKVPAPKEATPARTGPVSDFDRGEDIRDRVSNPIDAVITRYLLTANMLVFVTGLYFAGQAGAIDQYINGGGEGLGRVLFTLGAVHGYDIVHGQWWRLLTACFVHAGVIHLAMNMMALMFFGPMCERLWGHARFLLLYTLAGFGGNCAALISNVHGVVGASGAICGLMGAFGMWLLLNRRFIGEMGEFWMRNVIINGVMIAAISTMPRVSGAAHLGGAIAGAAVAFLFDCERYGARWKRLAALLGLALLPLLGVLLLQRTMYTSRDWLPYVLPAISKPTNEVANALTDVFLQQVKPQLELHPSRRDPARVEAARAALEERCAALAKQQGHWQNLGVFVGPELDEMRGMVLASLESGSKLCELARIDLEGGPGWKAADQALDEQLDDFLRKRVRWVNFIRSQSR